MSPYLLSLGVIAAITVLYCTYGWLTKHNGANAAKLWKKIKG